MSENFPPGDTPKNKITPKQDTLIQKKSGTIDRKMVGGSERLKEITKNQLGALDRDVIDQGVIKRFQNRAADIRSRFDVINQQHKEDTGLVMKGMDKIVGIFGGETVQATYESIIENLKKEAAAMLREIQNILPKVAKHLTPAQKSEMDTTLRVLSGILGDKLAVPTVAEMTGTTARALGSGENWKDAGGNALRGAKGLVEGVGESVWMVIKSIPDLAVFCVHFATQESTRDATAKFIVGVGEFLTENAWKGETWEKASTIIGAVISKEMKRIGGLPQGEQAEAIGRIPGLIIGALMGGGIVLKGVAKFGKGMEALGTTIQKAEGAKKLKKVGGKMLEKTGALAVGVGESGDLILGARRLKKRKAKTKESTSLNDISEVLNQRISEMSARLLAVGSRESTLNPDIAKILLQMRKDIIAAENAGNLPEVEALLKKADTYFDTHNRLMFPDQRLIHDPHAREVQSRIFAMMTSYSAHRPLSELGPRGREIGDEAHRLYREFQQALASKNPEQFDQIIKNCDRFQQNPEKYLDNKNSRNLVISEKAKDNNFLGTEKVGYSDELIYELLSINSISKLFKEFKISQLDALPIYRKYLADIQKSTFPNSSIPDIVWHGSRNNERFEYFDNQLMGKLDGGYFGRGFYFTPNILRAIDYQGNGGQLYPVLLNLKNPYRWEENQKNFYHIELKEGKTPTGTPIIINKGFESNFEQRIIEQYNAKNGTNYKNINDNDFEYADSLRELGLIGTKILQEMGHDGSIAINPMSHELEICIFDSKDTYILGSSEDVMNLRSYLIKKDFGKVSGENLEGNKSSSGLTITY